MFKNRYVVFIIACLVVMAVFAISYIGAYNLEISYKMLDNEDTETTVKKSDAIIETTNIVMELFDVYTNEVYESAFDMEVNLIGKNRSQVNDYIINLNSNISYEERAQGLLSYQLVYFSPETVTIRKNYDSSIYKCSYMLKEENGYVVVIEYPSGNLYHNTGILSLSLGDEDRQALSNGIEFNDVNELFDFLESYSS